MKKVKILLAGLMLVMLFSGCDLILGLLNQKGTITGTIKSSVAGYPALAGVTVSLSGSTTTALSDASGNFTIESAPGTVTLSFSKAGYWFNEQSADVTASETTAIPVIIYGYPLLTGGQYRIVLTWNQYPLDLDSHLVLPLATSGFDEVYFNHKNSTDSRVNLDVDDQTSYGPETTTIKTVTGGTYNYFVQNWSGNGTSNLGTSGATVRVYNSTSPSPIHTYYVSSASGADTSDFWRVFSFNGTTFTSIDTLTDTDPGL